MEGKYIFGIIETAKEESLCTWWSTTTYEEVYTIPYRDISAVVSDSPFVDYTTLPKNQVARYLLRHQQVIEKIMDSYTIIPMRLGTYVFNISEVKEILSKGYVIFKDISRKINNKIEIDVAATWSDLNSVIKEIGEGEEIKEMKEKLISLPEGVSVEDQIKIGCLIKDILDRERKKLTSEIGEVLEGVSIDSRTHSFMDDSMIFNTAFLIDKHKKAEFEAVLNELNKRYNEKINFRCVGPLPPYSFYTVEVKRMPFKEMDWARKILCLNEIVTEDEIERAHRNLVLVHHPDRNQGKLGTEGQFDEVTKAYKLLLEYILSAEQVDEDGRYSLRKEDVSRNFVIKIKG